jgi:hypothetical protein
MFIDREPFAKGYVAHDQDRAQTHAMNFTQEFLGMMRDPSGPLPQLLRGLSSGRV